MGKSPAPIAQKRVRRNSQKKRRDIQAPDARERIPPMGVVKRGLWAWRLFHFLMRRSRDVCGDAQRAHLPQCSATQASRTNTHQQKVFALQSPRNPKRATRSGVEEKNGISAEGRAKRVMPGFFFHSATRCATRATFQYQAKGDSFFKEAPHRCEEAFCQLNIEVSSLQVCRSSTPRQFNLLSAAGLGQPA